MLIRIILILSIPLLSIIFALMTSGIENLLTSGNKNWHTVPFLTWFLIWIGIWFFIYRYKFGTTKKLKRAILRSFIFVRNHYVVFIAGKKGQMNELQLKSIQIWKEMLKDKDTEMISCSYSQRRMLKNDNTLIVISTSNESNVMFIKSGEKSIYYDIWLHSGIISEMFNSFDKEQKIRFQRLIDEGRKNISGSITL